MKLKRKVASLFKWIPLYKVMKPDMTGYAYGTDPAKLKWKYYEGFNQVTLINGTVWEEEK